MPTVGWIHEAAVERRQAVEDARRGPAPKIPCPYCVRLFDHIEELQDHVRIDHPMDLPRLTIGGSVAGHREVLRQVVDPDAISLTNSSEISVEVDGARVEIGLRELPAWLAAQRSEMVRLEARNHRPADDGTALMEWVLEFRIAAPEELEACDVAFVQHLAVPEPTMAHVERFLQLQPGGPGAREYAGALADYVVGLLLKEQSPTSGVRRDLGDFSGKLMSVLEVLHGHSTKVSRSVTAVCWFCLNAWARLRVPIELAELHGAVRFYRSLGAGEATRNGMGGATAQGEPACYVDQTTKWIMEAAVELLQSGSGGPALQALEAQLNADTLTEYDLIKTRVLLAVAEDRSGNQVPAINHLRGLRFDEFFEPWARQRLNGR
jgi:hypothetical protein